MRRGLASRTAVAALGAALATSCGFLLDYGALQKGGRDAGTEASAGGSAGAAGGGAAGSAGSAGAGGASPCGVCDDGNPCTVDYCDTSSGTPKCAANGVKLDGFEQRISAARVHRVTMAAASDAFFLSAFTTTASGAEVTLYRVGAASSDASLQTVAQLSRVQSVGRPSSAAGLVVDTRTGLNLNAFVAIRDATHSLVHRIVLDGSYQVISDAALPAVVPPSSPGYDDSIPSRVPYAWKLGDAIEAAWINGDGTIGLRQTAPGSDADFVLGSADASMKPSSVAGLGTVQNTPVVLWTGPGSGVWTQVQGGQPEAATECMSGSGVFLPGPDTTSAQLAGFWFAHWSKATSTSLAAETRTVLCDGTSTPNCKFDPTCDSSTLQPGLRNVASDSMTRPGDSTGSFVIGIADPIVDVAHSVTSLLITAARFDFGTVPFQQSVQTQMIGFAQPVTLPSSGPSWPGPDLPAISLAAPDKMLVAWIEPHGTTDELVVQRYQLCLP